jgi:DNA-damage-inducible protein J
MEKTTLIKASVPAKRAKSAQAILAKLGMEPGDAINILMAQIVRHKGLPFPVRLSDEPLLTAEQQGKEWEEAFGAY